MNSRHGFADVDTTGTPLRRVEHGPQRSRRAPEWLTESLVRWVETRDIGSLLEPFTGLEHGELVTHS